MAGAGPAADVFVGRQRELSELREWLAAAQAGSGRLILLRSEPGMGKTRLAGELAADAAGSGVPVIWSRCPADAGAPPLWPLRRIVSQLPGVRRSWPGTGEDDFGGSAEGSAAARFAQVEWLADAIVEAARPCGLLVIIEDLHWADSSTASALGYLAAELPRSRAMVTVTARLLTESAAVGEVLDRPGVTLRQLDGLPRDAIVELLDSAAGGRADERYADLILRQTAGNCLFAAAVVRLLAERVSLRSYDDGRARAALAGSPELIELVREPIARVSAACRRLVECASVAGEDVDVVELVTASGLPADDVLALLDEAVQARLLTLPADSPGTARFVHALVRDGVYDTIEQAHRRELHRTLAAVVASAETGRERIATIASHLARGAATPADHSRAAAAARDAGRAALGDLGYPEAADQFRVALHSMAMAGGSPAAERAEVLLDLAFAEYRSGAFGGSLEHCLLAADLAEAEQRWDLQARAALLVDGVTVVGAEALEALCRRAAAAVPEDQLALRAQLHARLAYAAADAGDIPTAKLMSAEALALAERTDDPAALIAALRARHQALSGPEHPVDRLDVAERAVELGARGEPVAGMWGRLWQIGAALDLGDLVGVDRGLDDLERITTRLRFPLARWHLARLRATRESMVGRLAVAQQHSERARELAEEMDDHSLLTLYFAFQLFDGYLRGGMGAQLGRVEFLGIITVARQTGLPIALASAALALTTVGDLADAAPLARRLCRDAPTWPRDGAWIPTVCMLSNAVADLGDAEGAEVLYPLLEPFPDLAVAGGGGAVACDGSASRHLGRLAALCVGPEQAAGHLRNAIAHEERMGARPFAAMSRMYLADVLRSEGGAAYLAEAAGLARTALAAMRSMDMPGRAEQGAAVLAAIEAALAGQHSLTRREGEIVELVSAGLSNRQIAERLFLSERTVETHVSHVLTKLGGATRTDIVTWALTRR